VKIRHAAAMSAAVALVIPAAASAAPSQMKVTGGGQLISEGASGPGRTITFNAQGDPSSAKGHLQYNDHAGAKYHGNSTCVITGFDEERMANIFEIAGVLRDGTTYNIKGTDNGQGGDAPNDMILFDADSDDTTCDLEERDMYDDADELGRGNVKIHKTKGGSSSRRRSATSRGVAFTQTLQLPRLR
jgi:hypothetical protein